MVKLKLLLVLIATLLLLKLSAQSHVVDSLKNLLEKHAEEDTERVNLLNGVSSKMFGQSLEEAFKYAKNAKDLADKVKNHLFHKVKFADILYLKAEHVYVEIYISSGTKHLMRGSLTGFDVKLPANFFRTHRSFIINLDYLDAINNMYMIINGNEIPIGKNYREDLMKHINLG